MGMGATEDGEILKSAGKSGETTAVKNSSKTEDSGSINVIAA